MISFASQKVNSSQWPNRGGFPWPPDIVAKGISLQAIDIISKREVYLSSYYLVINFTVFFAFGKNRKVP